jgi:hypothetical protein
VHKILLGDAKNDHYYIGFQESRQFLHPKLAKIGEIVSITVVPGGFDLRPILANISAFLKSPGNIK